MEGGSLSKLFLSQEVVLRFSCSRLVQPCLTREYVEKNHASFAFQLSFPEHTFSESENRCGELYSWSDHFVFTETLRTVFLYVQKAKVFFLYSLSKTFLQTFCRLP